MVKVAKISTENKCMSDFREDKRTCSDDSGAVAVMVAIFLLTLVAFAAWAVDISGVQVERRSAQNTADVAALSGVQFANISTAAAEAEVRRISAVNAGITDTQWDTCSDPNRPAKFVTLAPNTACVSFTSGNDEIRVVIPDQVVPSIFAGAIGVESISVSAFAEAGGKRPSDPTIFPFGLTPGAGGPEVCLKANSNGTTPKDCPGSSQGNFGFLDFKLHTSSCNSAIILNLANGIDHALEVDSATSGEVHDRLCTGVPDRVDSKPGNEVSKFTKGLITNSSPLGRLQRGPNSKRSVMGEQLDDRPLWTYIASGSGLCTPGSITTHEEIATCLGSGNPVMFKASIADSPRFGWVPQIDKNFANGKSLYIIKGFVPVYIQTIFAKCKGSGKCKSFDPGESNDIPKKTSKAQAMTALIIKLSMLPQEVRDTAPGSNIVDYALTR